MRKTVLSLVSVAALALAGCQGSPSEQAANGGPASPESAATVSIPSEVSGTISLREGSPQPSDKATLVLNLTDVSSSAVGSAPLATRTSPAGTFRSRSSSPSTRRTSSRMTCTWCRPCLPMAIATT